VGVGLVFNKKNNMYDKKPTGYFKFVLAFDCETTGYNKETDDPSVGQQAVSWGIIVADAHTLLPIEKLYVEIKWNEESKAAKANDPNFGVAASAIHGLTYDYLEKHGIPEQDAVEQIGYLILKYWGPDGHINTLGHNVNFDLCFFRAMFRRHGINLTFGSRQIDSNSAGFVMLESFTSDQFFSTMGFDDREHHNAMEDIELTLESCRRLRLIWNDTAGLNAHDW
jgi:DNA polymerase III epsilon subunit-like protein